MRSVEEWEADPRQDAACDAALTTSLPPAAELILAELQAPDFDSLDLDRMTDAEVLAALDAS